MKIILVYGYLSVLLLANQTVAESLRCKGAIVMLGDSKVEVLQKCGEPELIDSYCENSQQLNATTSKHPRCENIDIWSYNPGSGKFLTNLYFAQGKLREMRYGNRIE